MNTSQGWSPSHEYDTASHGLGLPGRSLGLTPLGPAHAPFLPRHLYPQYLYGGGGDMNGLAVYLCQSCGRTVSYSTNLGLNSPAISASHSTSSASPSIVTTSSSSSTSTSTSAILTASPLTYSHSYPLSHLPPHPRHSHILHHPYPLPRRTSIPTSMSTTTSSSSSTYNSHAPIYPYHTDLLRSVSLGPDFIITGSYDLSVRTWDRTSGVLVVDLTGGHTGKIFCVVADRTKVVTCGEDLRICVWDFQVVWRVMSRFGVSGERDGWFIYFQS